MGTAWEIFEVHATDMVIQGTLGEGSEIKGATWRESTHILREFINNYKQSSGRNIGVKGKWRTSC
jgi:hypothetical protein